MICFTSALEKLLFLLQQSIHKSEWGVCEPCSDCLRATQACVPSTRAGIRIRLTHTPELPFPVPATPHTPLHVTNAIGLFSLFLNLRDTELQPTSLRDRVSIVFEGYICSVCHCWFLVLIILQGSPLWFACVSTRGPCLEALSLR